MRKNIASAVTLAVVALAAYTMGDKFLMLIGFATVVGLVWAWALSS